MILEVHDLSVCDLKYEYEEKNLRQLLANIYIC